MWARDMWRQSWILLILRSRTMNHWKPHKGWTGIQGPLASCTGKWLYMVPWCHLSCSLKWCEWPFIALCIAVCCKIIFYKQAPHAMHSKLAPEILGHLCCRAANGLWKPNISEVCSSTQIACKTLAVCRPHCRLVGAVLEENNFFLLLISKHFCSSKFPCYSALYEYSFWSWHDKGNSICSRLNQKQNQYYHINCLFTFFPDEWHLLTDRSIAKQSSQDEYAWQHTAPWMPSKVQKAS